MADNVLGHPILFAQARNNNFFSNVLTSLERNPRSVLGYIQSVAAPIAATYRPNLALTFISHMNDGSIVTNNYPLTACSRFRSHVDPYIARRLPPGFLYGEQMPGATRVSNAGLKCNFFRGTWFAKFINFFSNSLPVKLISKIFNFIARVPILGKLISLGGGKIIPVIGALIALGECIHDVDMTIGAAKRGIYGYWRNKAITNTTCTLIGGIFGFLVGGWVGACVGAGLGNLVASFISKLFAPRRR